MKQKNNIMKQVACDHTQIHNILIYSWANTVSPLLSAIMITTLHAKTPSKWAVVPCTAQWAQTTTLQDAGKWWSGLVYTGNANYVVHL